MALRSLVVALPGTGTFFPFASWPGILLVDEGGPGEGLGFFASSCALKLPAACAEGVLVLATVPVVEPLFIATLVASFAASFAMFDAFELPIVGRALDIFLISVYVCEMQMSAEM